MIISKDAGVDGALELNPQELAQINAWSRRELKAEEVYAFAVKLCDNEVDRDWERFPAATLEELAPLFAGKSGLGTRGDVILQLDWTIGEVMRTLDSLGLTDNTLLVFTSDNGPVIDDGYQDQALELLNGHTPMGIYRGGKYSLYEAGTRIPFIVRWPARVQSGVQPALFSQIDVYRSLASLTGADLPAAAAPDSRDRLPELLGEGQSDREYVVQQNLNNTLAIISGPWKYLEPSDGPALEFWTKTELGNSPEAQLYDLTGDPREQHNVAAEHPEVVAELAARLAEVRGAVASTVK